MTPIRLRPTMLVGIGLFAFAAATTATAQQVIYLTPRSNAEVDALVKTLRPGDTLKLLGTFESAVRITNRDFGGVTLDATGATLREGLLLQSVHNMSVVGGTFGRTDADTRDWGTFRIDNSSHISVSNATVVGNGNLRGAGVRIARSDYVTVRDSEFTGHFGSILVLSSTNSLVTRNRIVDAASDGIQIVDSQRAIVSANSCNWNVRVGNAHPDCIQFWSNAGRPMVSDIYILNNSAIGTMQAFFGGPATELTFAGNYAAVTFTHTISCGNCTNSSFFDNVLANLPHAVRGPGSLKIGTSPTNTAANNLYYDLRGRTDGWMPAPTWSSFVPDIAGLVGSKWDDRSFGFQLSGGLPITPAAAVPEPATWLMLSLGFLAVGRQIRQRALRGPKRVLA